MMEFYLLIALSVIIGVGATLGVVVLVLLTRRRHRMVIRERSFPLLAISCVGNLGSMITVAVDGYLSPKTHIETWTLFYLNLLFEYIFFSPYLLRLYHFKVCYADYPVDRTSYQRKLHRLTFRWYVYMMLWGLLPYFLVPVVIGVVYLFNTPRCYPECILSTLYIPWNLVCFCEALPLVLSVYLLRHTYEFFHIYSELRCLCLLTVLNSLLNLHRLHFAMNLIQECRNILALFISNFLPLYRSLDDRYEILLTPEVIESFTMTLAHKEALRAFSRFLNGITVDANQESLKGKVVKADAFLHLFLALSSTPLHPSNSTLRQIHLSYCLPLLPHLPEYLQSSLTADMLPVVEKYVQEVLEKEYFPKYLRSKVFAELEQRVELYLRIRNRDQEILEEFVSLS